MDNRIVNENFEQKREAMVTSQIEARGIKDAHVLKAMRKIERHLFIPEEMKNLAYNDTPLPIGNRQTISQPYIVALMVELANIKPDSKVLEIGTGSGYQTAILAELAKNIYSIELVKELFETAQERLKTLRYKNVEFKNLDGYKGWPEDILFDAIIVTAAAPEIPNALIKQLKIGGRLVIPLGDLLQELYVIKKDQDNNIQKEYITGVRFVPLVHDPT
jgi:protein-L-isoaspartate(D-aspartate) O-methyltransferase